MNHMNTGVCASKTEVVSIRYLGSVYLDLYILVCLARPDNVLIVRTQIFVRVPDVGTLNIEQNNG